MESRCTNRCILIKKLIIIIRNKADKIWLLIYVAIPSDRNVKKKESENELKYKM